MVYVDRLCAYPTCAIKPAARRYGTRWCHLWSDDEKELDVFAESIGLPRYWRQRTRLLHYDLTPRWRQRAVAAGAREMSLKDWLKDQRRTGRQDRKPPTASTECL